MFEMMFQIGQGLCQNVNENCAYDTVYAKNGKQRAIRNFWEEENPIALFFLILALVCLILIYKTNKMKKSNIP